MLCKKGEKRQKETITKQKLSKLKESLLTTYEVEE